MQAPMWVQKNIDLEKYRDRCNDIHQKKITELHKPTDVKKQAKTVEGELVKKHKEKVKTNEFLQSERNILINRDNQVLLNKLVEISHGKWTSVQQAPKRVQESQSVGPRSLNITVRKQMNEKIERENHAFAKRLFDKNGSLSKQRLDVEYQNHLKYRRQIQKIKKKKMPKLNGRTGLLPPIESGQETKRVQSMGGLENGSGRGIQSSTELGQNQDDEPHQQTHDGGSQSQKESTATAQEAQE